jgi:hypothetical protein
LERDRLTQELPEIPHLRLILWNISRIADNGKGYVRKAGQQASNRKRMIIHGF